MAKSSSSRRWLKRQQNDEYVRKAQQEGLRSRAAFKLLELQEKDRFIKPGMTVVDLGAAPGGWTQVALKLVGERGRVVALDILPMDALAGAEFIQGDFTEEATYNALVEALNNQPVGLIMSDMAPNISGIRDVDQPRAMYLAELAWDFAQKVLAPGGDFLVKLFQGEGFDVYCRQIRSQFDKVVIRKPRASRPKSREMYLLARGYKI
jgi:23S rRNA (uridine2552-2'-O)-methyltransferase